MVGNRWKLAFFVLFSLVIIGVIGLFGVISYLLFPEIEEKQPLQLEDKNIAYTYFSIHTSKEQLNEFLSQKIQGNYHVTLAEKDVIFQTMINVYSFEVPVEVKLIPEVAENGDILLKTHFFSLGRIRLPEEYVLAFIAENIDLPLWVKIYPNQRMVHLNMEQLTIDSELHFFVKEFNLQEDRIIMDLYSTEKSR